ncbi:DUF262 domain-containing protein [Phocaeicola vulgatus]|uniref:GmrSD restriction endonuclease domain-containing protein n=1 Tax=Phocaeicola vulgatus TaxID=821 RepID=UPI00356469A0
MATLFKTLKEYLYPDNGLKKFVIPNYQRGYKWSVRHTKEQTSVEFLVEGLKSAYMNRNAQQFFLQGVTVVEDGDQVILIDGQQRTTTLYLLLYCLGRENISGNRNIELDYSIRKNSQNFLNNLKKEEFDYQSEDPQNQNQDIYYFKEAIKQIQNLLHSINNLNRKDFVNFLLNNISMLYIVVDQDKAVRTFTMMNGQKAKMHDEELVKAEMLHIVSLSDKLSDLPTIKTLEDTFFILKEITATEWENSALRSKYAREWDKWLYWWNKKEVKDYFNTQKPMGLLLEYYFKKQRNREAFSFQNFKKLLPDNKKKQAKDVFKGLRDLQKDFEDIYNDPITYNYLKCALIGSSSDAEDKFNVIMYFIDNKRNRESMMEYAKWRLLGSTHIEITEKYTKNITSKDEQIDNARKRKERAVRMIEDLSKAKVYNVYDDILYKQLLRLNVEEYNKLNGGNGLKFDFSIWDNKSLEHIYPKSKFYHTDIAEDGSIRYIRGDGEEISKDEATELLDSNKVFSAPERYSEHCIGNLVLLYGRNNSEFGNLPFEEKKAKFFNNERSFDSRNLLHTIASFAMSKWGPAQIEEASEKIIRILVNNYNIELDEQQ